MKFNVEVDIDWIDDEEDLDQAIQNRIINNVAKSIEEKFLDSSKSNIAKAADKLITAKTEQLIYSVLEKPVTISNGWNSSEEYDSIYDMVEKRLTKLYEGKLNSNGKCDKDPLLQKIESYTERFVDNKVSNIEALINRHAKEIASKTLKESSLATTLKALIPAEKVNEAINK